MTLGRIYSMPKAHATGLWSAALAGVLVLVAGLSGVGAADESKIEIALIQLPPGFRMEVFARVPHAWSMAVAEELNAVFVGTDDDKVYAALDRDGDRKADEVVEIADDLRKPTSVAYEDGHLFVVTPRQILRYAVAGVGANRKFPAQVLKDDLPASETYGARDAAVGPDGKLYVSVSAPCDVCEVQGAEATILRLNTDGTGEELFASGVRSAAGLDFRIEESGQTILYFTDHGVGSELAADELNYAWRAGLNFGFPWYGGAWARTPEYENETPPADIQMPVIRFPPRSTPMGIHFYRGRMFPRQYRGDLFVAEHGSRDPAPPTGSRVLHIHFDEDRPVSTRVFAEGWLQDDRPWGRPVDIAELADGSLLISDSEAGAIYRVTYAPP